MALVLCLGQDPRDYFDFQQANAVKSLDDSLAANLKTRSNLGYEEAYGSLRESISNIKTMGLRDPLLSPDVAFKVVMTFVLQFKIKIKLFEKLQNYS